MYAVRYYLFYLDCVTVAPWPQISIRQMLICGSLHQISHSVYQKLENFVVSIYYPIAPILLKCGESQVTSTFTC